MKDIQEVEDMDPWTAWIINNGGTNYHFLIDKTSFDKLLELAVSTYGLRIHNRKVELKDQQQFLCTWWFKNKEFFKVYNSYVSVGKLLDRDHSTIIHSVHKRVKSYSYKENVACIKDFLES